jgi:hypothetical protein
MDVTRINNSNGFSMRPLALAIVAAFGMLFMSSCIPIQTNGTTHYLVVGIGIVSVNNTNQVIAQVTKATVIGGYASEHGGGIGYSAVNQIMVNTNSDIDIEVSNVPFKPLSVNVK